jgi:formiminoglutamase
MNITDYFEPVDFSLFKSEEHSLRKYAMGSAIEKAGEKLTGTAISKLDVAVFGVAFDNGLIQKKEASAPKKIRKALYRLASFDDGLKIADLGDLKPASSSKGTYLAIRDVVEYLRELKVICIILGGSQDLTLGICEAFKNERHFWLSVIDPVLDVKKGTESLSSSNYLTHLFKNIPNLFQFSLIGDQQHLTSEKLFLKTPGWGDHLRLGLLRENLSRAELLLRNSDVLSFDIGAVKFSDAPASSHRNPNGLRGEEACKLAHYAGMSQRMSVFGLFETVAANDKIGFTSALAAEITWYFLQGVLHRKNNANAKKRTAYKVEIEGLDHPVIFRHETETGRWWFEVQSLSGEVNEIACSEEEYKQAAKNEIPERWLRFIQKTDSLSK